MFRFGNGTRYTPRSRSRFSQTAIPNKVARGRFRHEIFEEVDHPYDDDWFEDHFMDEDEDPCDFYPRDPVAEQEWMSMDRHDYYWDEVPWYC